MLDWNDIRFVAAVARYGSTLAAADGLQVSQPTVARRIVALEEAIGVRLFDRLASGYRLTRAGEALLPAAKAVEDTVRRLEHAADAERRRISGTVRLTATPVIAELYVASALTLFRARYPEVQVEIFADDRHLDLEAGEADVAIRSGPRPAKGQLLVRRLARDRFTLFCSRAYADAHGIPETAEALNGHTLLLGAGPIGAAPIYAWMRAAAPAATLGYPSNSVSAHVASVRAGHGVGAMPRRLFGDNPDLVACFDAPDDLAIDTWLIAPERLRDDAGVRALLDFIGKYRGQRPAGVGAALGARNG